MPEERVKLNKWELDNNLKELYGVKMQQEALLERTKKQIELLENLKKEQE